jgi:hypothetical protein
MGCEARSEVLRASEYQEANDTLRIIQNLISEKEIKK